MNFRSLSPAVAAVGLTAACSGSASTGADAAVGATPTYYADIQPLLSRKCGACHAEGGRGPTAFVDRYDDVLRIGSDFACDGEPIFRCMPKRVERGEMPLGAGCSGNPNRDTDEACLTGQEQSLLRRWAAAGAPAGDPAVDGSDGGHAPTADAGPSVPPVDAGPGAPTYVADIQPLLLSMCGDCHQTGGYAGVPFVSDYDVAVSTGSVASCGGDPVYQCMLERVQAGEMPYLAGCSGDPGEDVGNPKCLNEAQHEVLEAWVAAGAPES